MVWRWWVVVGVAACAGHAAPVGSAGGGAEQSATPPVVLRSPVVGEVPRDLVDPRDAPADSDAAFVGSGCEIPEPRLDVRVVDVDGLEVPDALVHVVHRDGATVSRRTDVVGRTCSAAALGTDVRVTVTHPALIGATGTVRTGDGSTVVDVELAYPEASHVGVVRDARVEGTTAWTSGGPAGKTPVCPRVNAPNGTRFVRIVAADVVDVLPPLEPHPPDSGCGDAPSRVEIVVRTSEDCLGVPGALVGLTLADGNVVPRRTDAAGRACWDGDAQSVDLTATYPELTSASTAVRLGVAQRVVVEVLLTSLADGT